MLKTKLGVSIALVGAAMYFLGAFSLLNIKFSLLSNITFPSLYSHTS